MDLALERCRAKQNLIRQRLVTLTAKYDNLLLEVAQVQPAGFELLPGDEHVLGHDG